MTVDICVACHDTIAPESPKEAVVRDRSAVANGTERRWQERAWAHADHIGHAKRDGWRRQDDPTE